MNLQKLEDAPNAHDYLKARQAEEADLEIRPVSVGQVQLTDGGLLAIGDCQIDISEDAAKDLANLSQIPFLYFQKIDPDLRAYNFNRRFPQKVGAEENLVVISKDNRAVHVYRHHLPRQPVSRLIQIVLDEAPRLVFSKDIRAVEYHRNGRLDLGLVTSARVVEPLKGDRVYGGVHITMDHNGAVQLGPETFRLICSNGAMARVCIGDTHSYVRRGKDSDSETRFLKCLTRFAREAWSDWTTVETGLRGLTEKRLSSGALNGLIQRLRQRPFFISAKAARRVRDRLGQSQDGFTLYDLHNALTAVGTHDITEVLPQYRYRLRLGAGALARGAVGVCQECQQLILAA